jgi:hypothetical protein
MPTDAAPAADVEWVAEVSSALTEAASFVTLVPDTYLLAKRRYPFLPQRTVALDVTWQSFTPMARAAFLLDYVHRLYARTDVDAALRAEIGDCPTVVFRTTDHPKAAGQTTGRVDPREYAVFFDLDNGHRAELHMGHHSYVSLAAVMTAARFERRRSVRVS